MFRRAVVQDKGEMADILVAYFSRSGVTERLARELATKLAAGVKKVGKK